MEAGSGAGRRGVRFREATVGAGLKMLRWPIGSIGQGAADGVADADRAALLEWSLCPSLRVWFPGACFENIQGAEAGHPRIARPNTARYPAACRRVIH